jgi:hypothetical protein
MRSQAVNFAAVKQAVTQEAVLRHYQVDDLKGGRRRPLPWAVSNPPG